MSRAGEDPAGAVAAWLVGMAYVAVGPDAGLTASKRWRLLACACERGAGLVRRGGTPWEQVAMRLDVVAHRWAGADSGPATCAAASLTSPARPTLSPTAGRSPCPCPEPSSSTPAGARRDQRCRREAHRCALSCDLALREHC